MKEAVELLRSLNDQLKSDCVAKTENAKENFSVEKVFQPNNKKIQQIVPNQHRAWCRNFFKTEISFTKSIRAMNRLHVRKHFKISPNIHKLTSEARPLTG